MKNSLIHPFATKSFKVGLALMSMACNLFAGEEPSPDRAHMKTLDQNLESCLQKAQNTLDTNACFDKGIQEWTTFGQSLYEKLLKAWPQKDQTTLTESQESWETFKEKELLALKSLFASLEGSIWSTIYLKTRLDILRTRAAMLEDYLAHLEHRSMAEPIEKK
jgi:uncharacterized protein YecT (DUF1311 family)